MLARLARAREAEHAEATAFAEAAQTDDLTGLGNRRRGNALLDSLKPGDALLILDLDHFKDVNDRLGHREGDRVLIELGHFLASHLRDADDVARYGGEEFVVVLRGAGPGAIVTAERLLAAWREQRPLVTFSVGIALHGHGRSPALTFGGADAALYEAKRAGRDQARYHGDDAAEALPNVTS
jgi:diguanylate cyclase (GGDEF)-like protein